MRVLNKQKLEKQISSLFQQLKSEGENGLTEERFNQSLSELFEKNELEVNAGESRFVSVLIADIRGFTSLVEKVPPAKTIQILNVFFSTMVEIIDNHNGCVNKFMGDSIIAFFECSENVSESVLDVLHCAIEMQIAMDEVNKKAEEMGLDPLYMGIGVNTGDVIASVLGSEMYREYTIIGTTVNLASRIEGHTLRGQILLSDNTLECVDDSVDTGQVNEVSAKGMREPLRFCELRSVNTPVRLELPKRDSRRAPRIHIRIPVYFQLLEGKKILPEVYEGEVVDISYGGMMINTPKLIDPYSDIKLSLNLFPRGDSQMDIYAKALYVQESSEGAEVGLEFTIIDDDASIAVKKFVDSLF